MPKLQNQDNNVLPTELVLKLAYIKWLPSVENHVAFDELRISSAKKVEVRDCSEKNETGVDYYLPSYSQSVIPLKTRSETPEVVILLTLLIDEASSK